MVLKWILLLTARGLSVQPSFKKPWFSLSLGGLAIFEAVQDPGKELLQIFPHQGQSCLSKMYKFLPKCANSSPWRGKSHYDSSPGVVGEKKVKQILLPGCPGEEQFDFLTRRILTHRPDLSRQEKNPPDSFPSFSGSV